MCITVLDSIYNIVLLFACCLFRNLRMMAELTKYVKDEQWQRVTHAYYGRWRIFMALYFEMRHLPWLKRNGRRQRKILAKSETFTR